MHDVDLEESRRRLAEARARRRAGRQRLAALGALALLALAGGAAVGAGAGDDAGREASAASGGGAERTPPPPPPELPRGGRSIFPEWRVVGFYGAPQDDQLGILGIGPLSKVAAKLQKQARPYARKTRPVLPAFELLATIALADPGEDGMYRARQPREVIDRHLRVAREAKALLLLDIQPGHADFEDEVERLRPWLREPDVSLALDPEWATPGAKPGTVIGSVEASQVNKIARTLSAIVKKYRLPEKMLVIHQFTNDMIKSRETLEQPPGVAVVLNVDGFGTKPAKVSKYRSFTEGDGRRFHHGFKLFYEEDTGLMSPRSVLAMNPPPDLVVYE
jgi:hypothetical protein